MHLAVVKLLKMCVKTSTTITTIPLVSAYADLKFALTMNFLTLTSACANADQRSVQKSFVPTEMMHWPRGAGYDLATLATGVISRRNGRVCGS